MLTRYINRSGHDVSTPLEASGRPLKQMQNDHASIRVGVLLGVIGLLNLTDLRYTLFAYHAGILKELNPLAAHLIRLDVESSLVCFKLLTMLVGSFILWKVRRSPWAGGACWLLVVVYTGLALMWISCIHSYLCIQRGGADWAVLRPLLAGY